MGSGVIASWVVAGSTFAAVLVALFGSDLRRAMRHPKLEATIKPGAPDCHLTQITASNFQTGQPIGTWSCYYFRVWIKNAGNLRAEKVQVYASRLMKKHADGSYAEEDRFLPMNLRWSHTPSPWTPPEIFAEGISPGMGKHCDLFHIADPIMRKSGAALGLPDVSEGVTIGEFDVEVRPNNMGHLIGPGEYRLELLIAAANARPAKKTVEINLTGRWYPNEKQMFADAVGLSSF